MGESRSDKTSPKVNGTGEFTIFTTEHRQKTHAAGSAIEVSNMKNPTEAQQNCFSFISWSWPNLSTLKSGGDEFQPQEKFLK